MDIKALRGSLLLLLASAIWGAAFAAQRVGMDHIGPFAFTGIRMLLAGLVMIPVSLHAGKKQKTRYSARKQIKGGIFCGLFLFAATCLQQVGIISTDAGKAGFVTALYVVLVPLAGWLILGKNPGRVILAGVALALVALYLLCVPVSGFRMEAGDLLLLGCAVCFTGQILCVDRFAPHVSGTALARDEFLVTGGLSMLIALFTEEISFGAVLEAAVPILYTGLFSSAVAYTLQIIGQRDTDPTLASLIMCLESVFALLSGAVLLGERMNGREIAGCALMFAAVIVSQLSPVIQRRRARKNAS
ncbi:MAG: DMT family transporter [Clostridia bacterium]|nr:DMT family transporter [Clostridia bacterium]